MNPEARGLAADIRNRTSANQILAKLHEYETFLQSVEAGLDVAALPGWQVASGTRSTLQLIAMLTGQVAQQVTDLDLFCTVEEGADLVAYRAEFEADCLANPTYVVSQADYERLAGVRYPIPA